METQAIGQVAGVGDPYLGRLSDRFLWEIGFVFGGGRQLFRFDKIERRYRGRIGRIILYKPQQRSKDA
jgi:hypothetical protein